MSILALELYQLFVGATFNYFSIIKNKNTVGHPNRGEPVADKNGRPTVEQLSKVIENFILAFYIQGTGRLVKNNDLRISEKGPRQSNFLPFADTKLFTIKNK